MMHMALSLCPSPPPPTVSGPEQGPHCYFTHWQSGSWTQDLVCLTLHSTGIPAMPSLKHLGSEKKTSMVLP